MGDGVNTSEGIIKIAQSEGCSPHDKIQCLLVLSAYHQDLLTDSNFLDDPCPVEIWPKTEFPERILDRTSVRRHVDVRLSKGVVFFRSAGKIVIPICCPFLDMFEDQVGIVCFIPNPYEGSLRPLVDFAHDSDLLISFRKEILIDADGVHPQTSPFVWE